VITIVLKVEKQNKKLEELLEYYTQNLSCENFTNNVILDCRMKQNEDGEYYYSDNSEIDNEEN
jgi:hypothetical protein